MVNYQFGTFLITYFIGVFALFFWQGTWTVFDLFKPYIERPYLYVMLYAISTYILLLFAVFANVLCRSSKVSREIGDCWILDLVICRALDYCHSEKGQSSIHGSSVQEEIRPLETNIQRCKIKSSVRMLFTTLWFKCLLYVFEIAQVASWHGPWSLLDIYVKEKFNPWIVCCGFHLTAYVLLTIMKGPSLVVLTPFHSTFTKDREVNFFFVLTGFESLPSNTWYFHGRCLQKVIIFGNLVFIFWYSTWGLFDLILHEMFAEGISSIPVVLLPFVALFSFIPSFFVVAKEAEEAKHYLLCTLLNYIQGLCNAVFWIFCWSFSARIVPNGFHALGALLSHFLSFLICAFFGVAINFGI